MTTPLIPQEIYLLERYCGTERFGQARDAWAAMVKHAEEMLARFMLRLPPDYRNRPLWNQPDRVWGEGVLPNFRNTLHGLNTAYIGLTHGDLTRLRMATAVQGDLRGQNMDYPPDWMDEVEAGAAKEIGRLSSIASDLAEPIRRTARGEWSEGCLTTLYDKVVHEPLDPPSSWPIYRKNESVTVRSGDRVPKTGIYLPDVEGGFPRLEFKAPDLLGEADIAIVYGPSNAEGRRPLIDVPCTWTLVERVSDFGGGPTSASDHVDAASHLRCEAGDPCPKTGYWFTPAKVASRRSFAQFEAMPSVGGDYGLTIWQWDPNQTD